MDLSNRELTILNITQKMSEDINENAVAEERLTMIALESELERIQLSSTVIFNLSYLKKDILKTLS